MWRFLKAKLFVCIILIATKRISVGVHWFVFLWWMIKRRKGIKKILCTCFSSFTVWLCVALLVSEWGEWETLQQLSPAIHVAVMGWKLSYCNQHNNLHVTTNFQLFTWYPHPHKPMSCIFAQWLLLLWQCDTVHKNPFADIHQTNGYGATVTSHGIQAKPIFQRNNL